MDVVGESHEIYAAKNRNEAACEKCVSVSHIRGGLNLECADSSCLVQAPIENESPFWTTAITG